MTRRINISENQLSLPFGERSARTISYEDRARFFWFLVSISLLSLLFYIYAVNATAHHIAVRENLESEVSETSVRLSTLEFTSIALKNDITLEVAHSYGFKEALQPLYVSRDTSYSLTLNR